MRLCPRCTLETDAALCPVDGAATIEVQDSQPATYAVGTLLADRYRVEQVLGIGGFGAVYKCTQLNMNQTVAVKVLRNEHLASVEHVKRFTREAQSASKLAHPNTIRIFDFGQHKDGALYLAMEYVEGETLAHRMDTRRTLPWSEVAHVITQVCHSLTEAHAAGLVHRDLKPENVMLVQVAGDPHFVKVLDFGIAKTHKAGQPGNSQLTESGMIMGTPTYMSPEQARGDDLDGRSDIYALGVLMYEALVGQPPFVQDTPMAVLVSHVKDPVPPMPASAHVPPAIERVVRQCLEKQPSQRPATTAELVDRLQVATQVAQAVAARPATPVATVRSEVVEPPAGPTQLTPAPVLPEPPAPLPPTSRAPVWIGLGAFSGVAALAAAAVLLGEQAAPAASAQVAAPAPVAASAQVAAPAQVVTPAAVPPAPAVPPAQLAAPGLPPPAPAVRIAEDRPPHRPSLEAPARPAVAGSALPLEPPVDKAAHKVADKSAAAAKSEPRARASELASAQGKPIAPATRAVPPAAVSAPQAAVPAPAVPKPVAATPPAPARKLVAGQPDGHGAARPSGPDTTGDRRRDNGIDDNDFRLP
jgi:serine/threonine-protein kinase